ncbi:proteasome endopeptidase complex, beta subunit [Nadsonia fulvescens var. elongata DSM 6958]|uniref:Proteasome subunit beta n=1 Tax=Nadsonia fulvescens var. elongata DSM 6958 TaxID=857566 RepID=A0A1E3PEL6_9ASCO|nr:proteasome endopeptidase complex, beta subunit [Nadsonia fulvescens var. elongata DSM 6958]
MEQRPVNWGRPRDDIYGAYDHNIHNAAKMPTVHTQQPIVTGTSVIAVKFDKGVMMAADNLASYGSLARFTDQERLIPVGKDTVVGVSGDISDLQYVERLLEQLEIEENYDNDGHELKSSNIFEYLSRVFYQRRSKMDPLWNAVIVAGVEDGKPFLSYVDLLGVTYSSPTLATGFGAYLAVPLLRQVVDKEGDEDNLTEEDARKLIDKCMKVLFYRDARSIDKYSVATITSEGAKLEKNVKCVEMNWRFAEDIKGYGRTVA